MFSGYPEADRSAWAAFAEEFRRTHAELHASFDEFRRECGAPPLPGLEFMDTSPYLNLYGYPDEVDYARARPLGATWHNVQTSVRTSEPWELRSTCASGPGALLYLSLGSLGSADVELMQRLVDILGATEHRVIVSKGPLAEQIRLHDNMCGEGYLPQPAILPQVDLVITHGGNNTTCEALHHGKPMVVLPIFWDQYDNAQRIHETGLGVRLSTYGCEAAELTGAVDRLLADAALQAAARARMAERLQSRSGTVAAADLIERLASSLSPREARPGRACRGARGATRRGSASGRPPRATARTRAARPRARRTVPWPPRAGRGLWKISSSTWTPSERASPAAARSERVGIGPAAHAQHGAAELGPTARHRRARAGSPRPARSPARSAARGRRAARRA